MTETFSRQSRPGLIDRKSLGDIMLIIAGCLIVSLAGCLFEPASLSQAWAFLLPAGISAAAGLALRLLAKPDRPLVRHWDALTVVTGWLWGFFIGALSFWLLCQLTPVQALFESVSGWTTTGLSVMDVEAQSRLILFYRSFMQYCGGLGFLLMMAMLIQNRQSAALYAAEGHADWLVPNLMATARTILKIYLLFLAGGILAYMLAGVTFFDALCTTMCALSTGGFANYGASVGHWHSAAISLITIVLMIAGTTNFLILALLLKGRFRRVSRITEVRLGAVILVIATAGISLLLMDAFGLAWPAALLESLFEAVSALSTSGFSLMSYTGWPPAAIGIMIVLMLCGGGLGSTAGGIKLFRVAIASRLVTNRIMKKADPARQVLTPSITTPQRTGAISDSQFKDAAGFILLYLVIFLTGSILLAASAGCSMQDAFFEFASSLGTVGLSVGVTSAAASAGTLLIEITGMILGRLELFLVFTALITLGRRLFRPGSLN